MKILELIKKLQEIQKEHGDVEIMYYFHGEGEKFTYYEIDYNKDDSLFLYIGGIPKKNRLDNEWIAKELRITDTMLLDKDLFPEVKWSDNEPTKVKLVIDK